MIVCSAINMILIGYLFATSVQLILAQVKVKVKDGWLQGEQVTSVLGQTYYSFKGIPYAVPPLGTLRFKAPKPALPWDGIRNATQHGSMCTQYDIFTSKISGNEDCLFLNVYSPEINPEVPLAVMVYIHGGGYVADSGNTDNYGPDFLVDQGVVLVTMNYRLDSLGFLVLNNSDVPGNAGMKDQVTALKWVKENVKNFGGDPDKVTIFGQSAGGASVILHVISKMSEGLFNRAISMSGVPSSEWSISYEPRRRAFALGKEIGLDTSDETKLLEFLQSLSVEKLVGTNLDILVSESVMKKLFKIFYFEPTVETDFGQDRFLSENPEESVRNGRFKDVDLLIGHTNAESILDFTLGQQSLVDLYSKYSEQLVPRKIFYEKNMKEILKLADEIKYHYFGNASIDKDNLKNLLIFMDDQICGYPISKYIKFLFAESKSCRNNMFVYQFSAVSERNVHGNTGKAFGLSGASHSDDLVYLFDPKEQNLTLEIGSREYKLVKQTSSLFANFAKLGNPSPSWPRYDSETKAFMDINDNLTIGSSLDKAAVEFWDNIYEKSGISSFI